MADMGTVHSAGRPSAAPRPGASAHEPSGIPLGSRQLAALLPALTGPAAGDRPAYRVLAQAIRALVLDGRIALRVKLPAERELATTLALSRATVTAAYDLLRESGYARSRRGSGTWTVLPEGHRHTGLDRLARPDSAIDLSNAVGGLAADVLTDALAEIAPLAAQHAHTPGYHPYGLPELRAAVAERYTRRGLPTRPEQILITSGALQALGLALGMLCGPGDRVLVENPTYTNALDAIRRARTRTVPVAVADDGWDLEIIESTLRQAVPRLAYMIPYFHNPTGNLMPPAQRAELIRATQRSSTWLVADETIADLALDVPAPAPFASHAERGGADHVITIGSMSKSHWGGLRIGWLRATPRLVTELAGVRVSMDMAGSVIDQLVALPLLRRMDELVAARVAEARARRAALVAALVRDLPEWSWRLPPGGLSLWVDLGEPIATALADRAAGYGVRIEGGSRFGAEPGTFEHRLRLPFTLPSGTLDEAVQRVALALHDTAGRPLASAVSRPHWMA
ncbi:PLP-dependent aminotransferase family protein [Streptomyces sp. NPDC006733]|uniref:MocR-like transcription factor YczR n=1 Tax=Streptomyces sp. NPDC006733 TaxID=3155460 RepID=UPI0033F78862